MKTRLRNATVLVFAILMIQSCGVIEKRRYSNAWNINLGFNRQAKVDGKQTPLKKEKRAVKPKTETYVVVDSSSFVSDTDSSTSEMPTVIVSLHADERKIKKHINSVRIKQTSIVTAYQPLYKKQIENKDTEKQKKKEFFSFASAMAFCLFLLCIPLTFLIEWSLYEFFLTIGVTALLLAWILLGIAAIKANYNCKFYYLLEDPYYVFSYVMFYLTGIGLIVLWIYVVGMILGYFD